MQKRKYYLWFWLDEGACIEEYSYSVNSLKRFVAVVDVKQLYTLEDVSACASLVGHDLDVVAVTKGQEVEEKTEYFEPGVSDSLSRTQKKYIFRASLHDHELGVTAQEGLVSISTYRRVGFQGYQREELRVTLPSDRDIAIGNVPNLDEQSIYALDLRGASQKKYFPAEEPWNAQIQQEFMRLLRECIQDFVSALAIEYS